MSGKRQATTDLNHDNWDREEEPEERGTFRTATEDELKNRIIKKAKRKIAPGDDNTDGGSGTKSIFSGFSGFGKPPTSSASTSAFSFLNKIPAVAAATCALSTTTTSETKPQFSFNSGLSSTTKTSESSAGVTFKNTVESVNASESVLKPKISTGSADSSEYHKKLSSLNQAVCEWIKAHVDRNPLCILSPIFKDYEKYLDEIENDKKTAGKEGKTVNFEEKNASGSGVGNFKFSVNTTNNLIPKIDSEISIKTNDMETKTNGFNFGTKKTESTLTKPSATSSFSFNIKPMSSSTATTTSSASSFSFGNLTQNATQTSTSTKPFSFAPGSTPFSFGNIKPPEASAQTLESEQNEEEDEEPPKNEFKQVVEDDAVYSKKCKVFVKKDGNFVDKGVGTLYLKPVESTAKTQLLVRADTNLGNILVNLILNSAIPAQRMGKNNVMLVCLPTPDADKPTSMLLRVKTGEEADELLENIKKYKK